MSQQIVPFDFKTNDVVAGGSYFADSANEFVGGAATGFPSLSIKGREFAINRNGETKTVKQTMSMTGIMLRLMTMQF